jgi:predicted O-linked N-acetylglucosamine transferase (SPINDLY family)
LDNNYRLVALRPDNANAHFNLSDVLLALRRYDDALAAANDALAIVDKHPGALLNRGVALASMGEIVLAQESLTAAVQVDPSVIDRLNGFLSHPLVASDLDARLIYIHEGLERFETCNWLGWDNFLERLIPILHDASQEGAHFQDRSLLFRVAALPIGQALKSRLAMGISERISHEVRSQPRLWVDRPAPASGPQRIRISYVGAHLGNHARGFNAHPLFSLHDRERFDVYLCALDPSDESAQRAMNERAADVFRDLSALSDADAAFQIYRDNLDLIVDLTGYTGQCRPEIFA